MYFSHNPDLRLNNKLLTLALVFDILLHALISQLKPKFN